MEQPGTPRQFNFPRPLTPDDILFHAVHPNFLARDGTISSAAFNKDSKTNKMSCDWAELSTPQESHNRWTKWGDGRGVAAISAKACWDAQQIIEFTPDAPDVLDGNPSHSDVFSHGGTTLTDKRIRERLQKEAVLVFNQTGPLHGGRP
jgi:hypothetical protein